MEQIDVDEAATRVADGAVLLDVREQVEWDAGHAEGAVHLPLSELQERVGELDTNATYAIICRSGARSNQAAMWLEPQGYDVANVTGGSFAWEASGRSMVTDGGDEGYVLSR